MKKANPPRNLYSLTLTMTQNKRGSLTTSLKTFLMETYRAVEENRTENT